MVMVCPKCGTRYSAGTTSCQVDGTSLVKLSEDPYVGYKIDKYCLQKRIGKGGFGVVYLAEHSGLGSQVAIKILRKQYIADEQLVERFHREARVSSQINHENVVQIVDFGYDNELGFYFIMEFLDGTSLTQVMKNYPMGMPVERILPIFRQICAALERAHSLHVVHRDLKPSNILLIKAYDRDDVVKVLDFGIAKVLQGEEGKGVTVTGQIVGSPRFMSPEQARGRHSEVDPRSDIYSLGVMLFWMLTGKIPFESKQLARLLYMHVKTPAPSLSDIRPEKEFPAALEEIVAAALAKSKDQRPSSANAFFQQVELACRGYVGASALGASYTSASLPDSSSFPSMNSAVPEVPTHYLQPGEVGNQTQSLSAEESVAAHSLMPTYDDEDEVERTVVDSLAKLDLEDPDSTMVSNRFLVAENGPPTHPILGPGPGETTEPQIIRRAFDDVTEERVWKTSFASWKYVVWGTLVGMLLLGFAFVGWRLGRSRQQSRKRQQIQKRVEVPPKAIRPLNSATQTPTPSRLNTQGHGRNKTRVRPRR